MYADQQTHALPRSDDARHALCAALAVPDWASLTAKLDTVRAFVQQQFENIFSERGSADADAASDDSKLVRALWFGMGDGDAALEEIVRASWWARGCQYV